MGAANKSTPRFTYQRLDTFSHAPSCAAFPTRCAQDRRPRGPVQEKTACPPATAQHHGFAPALDCAFQPAFLHLAHYGYRQFRADGAPVCLGIEIKRGGGWDAHTDATAPG